MTLQGVVDKENGDPTQDPLDQKLHVHAECCTPLCDVLLPRSNSVPRHASSNGTKKLLSVPKPSLETPTRPGNASKTCEVLNSPEAYMTRRPLVISPLGDDITISESLSRAQSQDLDPWQQRNTEGNSPSEPHAPSCRCSKPLCSITMTRLAENRNCCHEKTVALTGCFHPDWKQQIYDDVSSDSWTGDDEFYHGQHLPLSQTLISLTSCVPATSSSQYDLADKSRLMSPVRAWLNETDSPVSLPSCEHVPDTTATTPTEGSTEQLYRSPVDDGDHQMLYREIRETTDTDLAWRPMSSVLESPGYRNAHSRRDSLRQSVQTRWQSQSQVGQAVFDKEDGKHLKSPDRVQVISALVRNTASKVEVSPKETLNPSRRATEWQPKLSSPSAPLYTGDSTIQSDSDGSSPAASRGSSLPRSPAVPWSPVSPSFHKDLDGPASKRDVFKQPSGCMSLRRLAPESVSTSDTDNENEGESMALRPRIETHQRHEYTNKATRSHRADSGVEGRLANDGQRSVCLSLQ